MPRNSLLRRLAWLAAIIIVAVAARLIIIGGKPLVKLSPAPAMTGAVSTGLGQTGPNSTYLQQEGKDYKLKSVHYFDNGDWAVANVLPVKNNGDPALLVFKKINGIYQAVLGPDSTFDSSYFHVMPLDVGQYLSSQGAYGG
jgi:hypothetical protein